MTLTLAEHTQDLLPTRELEDPDCLADEQAAELLRPAPWASLVVVGDSVAAGIREPVDGYVDRGFGDRVGNALAATRPGFRFTNLGMRDLRLKEITESQVPAALSLEPDLVLIAAGGNDALGRQFNITEFGARLDDLIRPLAASGAMVVTVGLFDLARSGLMPAEYRDLMAIRFDHLDAITRRASDRFGGVHIDTHHHPRSADPAIFSSDRIHCNARGHAIAYASIVTELARTLR